MILLLSAKTLRVASATERAPDFFREIRWLLEQSCIKCHGPKKEMGGLRVDTKDGAYQDAVRQFSLHTGVSQP